MSNPASAPLQYIPGAAPSPASIRQMLINAANAALGPPTTAVGAGMGTAVAEVDTFTFATPAANDIVNTVVQTGSATGPVVANFNVTVGSTPTATTLTTQMKTAWAANAAAAALATASGTATFILTAATAGAPLFVTITISLATGGTTVSKVVTTKASGITILPNSTQTYGGFQVNTGTSVGTSGIIATFTFAQAFVNPPYIEITPGNAAAANIAVAAQVYVDQAGVTTTTFTIKTSATAIADSTTYLFNYQVSGM